MRNSLSLPILAAALAAGGAGLSACREQAVRGEHTAPVAVAAVSPDYESVPLVVSVPGTVRARHRITLASQIHGFVREVRVRAGDEVTRGQLLLLLDARDAEAQRSAAQAAAAEAEAGLAEARRALEASEKMLAAARSAAELAQSTFARYQKLFAARSVAQQELDEARARRDGAAAELAAREAMAAAARERIRQAEARMAQAGAQLGRADVVLGWTTIAAPESGRVAQRLVDPGSALFPGTPLLVVETARELEVVSSVPAAQAGLLKRGLGVRVAAADPGRAPATATITEIAPLSDSATHTVEFKAALPAGLAVLPGTFVRLEIPAGSRRALLVPRAAVRETGQLAGVFVVDSSARARYRLVKAEPYDADRLELIAGIEPGERVIVDPPARVLDGTPVEVRP